MSRIVSLLPSASEIVAALGHGGALVGRSHECDFPSEVAALPALTRAKLDAERDSAAIDRQVRALVEQALSVYAVDAERLRELAPEVIVTQAQCEVCAVSLGDVERAVADWSPPGPRLVSLQAETLEGIFDDIAAVAAALDDEAAGEALVHGLRQRVAELAMQAEGLNERPSVVCLEWLDPIMVAGTWVPELVRLAGAQDPLGPDGGHALTLDWDAVVAADPDVLVLMPCGFDIARCRAELPALTARPGWSELRALRDGRVAVTDGNQYFNRPGPRIVEGLEILMELLHPGRFDFGHRGSGWEPLDAD